MPVVHQVKGLVEYRQDTGLILMVYGSGKSTFSKIESLSKREKLDMRSTKNNFCYQYHRDKSLYFPIVSYYVHNQDWNLWKKWLEQKLSWVYNSACWHLKWWSGFFRGRGSHLPLQTHTHTHTHTHTRFRMDALLLFPFL